MRLILDSRYMFYAGVSLNIHIFGNHVHGRSGLNSWVERSLVV